jgi:hypothetical protein
MAWPRTKYRAMSRFNTTLFEAKQGLEEELRKLGAKSPIVTTNLPLNRSGWPDSKAKRPDDVGVAVYFTRGETEVCFPCDKWITVADNLHAIELTIAAIRGIERWGAKEMMDAAFKGYAALPEPSSAPSVAWWTVLEISPDATEEEKHRAYRALARKLHPDVPGGDAARFLVVQAAYEQALAVA